MYVYQLKIKIIGLLIIYPLIGLVANTNIDSLLSLLSKPISEIERCEILNELAFLELDNNNILNAKKYAEESLLIAQKIDYSKGVADAQIRIGTLARIEGHYNEAISYYELALPFRKMNDTQAAIASVYNLIGICYFYQNNFERAIEEYRQGLTYLGRNNEIRVKGGIFHNLAELYSYTENYEYAIPYLDSCKQVWIEIGDSKALVSTLQEIGHLHKEFKNFEEALKSIKQSLKIAESNNYFKEQAKANLFLGNLYFDYETNQSDLALKYYLSAEKMKRYLEKNNHAILLKNLGDVFQEQNKIQQALEYYKASQDIFNAIDEEDINWNLAEIHYEMGNIHKKQKLYPKAEKYYLSCLTYFGSDYHPYDKANTYLKLSEVYKQLDDTQNSTQYFKKYSELKDSIYFNRIDAVNLQHNLEIEKKEKAQIEAQYQKIKAENLERSKINQRNYFVITFIGLILTAMFFVNQNHQKRQIAEFQTEQALLEADKAHLETQQAQLETNKAYMEIDHLLQNQELVIATARLNEKEATQKQIGKDLHDSIGASLAAIKLYFSDIFERLDVLSEEMTKKQYKTLELLDETTEEVRRISHSMQSGVLKKFGLAEGIKQLGNTINDAGKLNVKVYTYGIKEAKANNIDFKLYKIIQELVSNVLKHAKANQLTISLTKQEKALNLMVEDDGVGFDTSRIGDKDGIGLKNITYRVTDLGGICHFDSVQGRGTTVIIDIPLKSDA